MAEAEVRELGDLGFCHSEVGLQEEDARAESATPAFGPRFPFSETSNGFIAPLRRQDELPHTGPWHAYDIPAPSHEPNRDGLYPIGPLRSVLPNSNSNGMSSHMSLQQMEEALIASAVPPREPAIRFGQTDPSRLVFSAPSSSSPAKRRMVHQYERDVEPRGMSIRDELADPVRGVDRDPVRSQEREREETMSPPSDAVRTPRTPELGQRMAPPSTEVSPFQLIPKSFRPREMGTPEGLLGESFERGRGSSFAVDPKVCALWLLRGDVS
ncbi:hypothetical protein CALVIDRAFT_540884 [Calocera viscosa TUFC12733]|uniref:Uncharacterized protein n=1 Tax=Calocera viscosa (strain TUFC12733) TaxID=1330018 RepID=A0A167IG69_CALVF|nr:hypothetical protein CALVIDRAFT_540884 [Calocera viscosa TUFC12733]